MRYRKHEEETRTRLRTALIGILENKDINKVTVSEVIKSAGVSKPTFYKYYPDVYGLLEDIVVATNDGFYSEHPEFPPLSDGNLKRMVNYLRGKPWIIKCLDHENTRNMCYGTIIRIIDNNFKKYVGDKFFGSPNSDFVKIGIVSMVAMTVLHYIDYNEDEIIDIEKFADMFIDTYKNYYLI